MVNNNFWLKRHKILICGISILIYDIGIEDEDEIYSCGSSFVYIISLFIQIILDCKNWIYYYTR